MRCKGIKTLLVDGDLRCPSLEEVFLRGRNRGMTEFLRGRAEPQDICYPTQVNGLYFIPSGELRSNPAELLSGPRLGVLIEQASQYFDKIVIDGAPLVPVSDGLMLASHADATCLVVRSNTTKKNELHRVASDPFEDRASSGWVHPQRGGQWAERVHVRDLHVQATTPQSQEQGR